MNKLQVKTGFPKGKREKVPIFCDPLSPLQSLATVTFITSIGKKKTNKT